MPRPYLPASFVLYSLPLVPHILIFKSNTTNAPAQSGNKSKSMCIFFKFRFYNFTTRHRQRRVFEEFGKTTANSAKEHNSGKSESATKKRILQQQYSN
jgi:hypothetical protein